MSFFRGVLAPYRGLVFVARHGLWSYLLLPLILNVGVAIGSSVLAVRLARRAWLGDSSAAMLDVGISAGIYLAAALMTVLLFIVLQPLVSAPFVDLLSEKVERLVRGQVPGTGVFRSVWQALLHGALKAALYACALLLTLILGAFTGVGGLLGAACYGIFLAFDGFDYPLARRAVSFGGKWRYLASHPAQTVGYCCGAGLLYLVPLAALVAPAFAAVGATLAFLDTDAAGSSKQGQPPGGRAGTRGAGKGD